MYEESKMIQKTYTRKGAISEAKPRIIPKSNFIIDKTTKIVHLKGFKNNQAKQGEIGINNRIN